MSLFRGWRGVMSSCVLLHPSQLLGIWSWLVPAASPELCSPLPSHHTFKGKSSREQRTFTDPVRITHSQLRHFPGGRPGPIHPRGTHSPLYLPCCRASPQPWGRCLAVLFARHMLILWPHAPLVALGLDSMRLSRSWIIAGKLVWGNTNIFFHSPASSWRWILHTLLVYFI